MPKLPIFRFGSSEPPSLPELQFYGLVISLNGLQLGVDNLRYDVYLSPRVTQEIGTHLTRLICRFGGVESLLELDVPTAGRPSFMRPAAEAAVHARKAAPADLKSLLVSLHQTILNRAKAEENPSVDLLGRLAVLKFIRTELQSQFSRILEQCRMKSKSLEGFRQAKMLETQELVGGFQVRKKIILRKAGQEVFRVLREIEKETLARTRRSLFGDITSDTYRLFLNPLIFTEDGRDDYLCAEHYYMFGNFDKDPDRFANLRQLAINFLRQIGYHVPSDDKQLELALNVPENAAALVGTGEADDAPDSRERRDRLEVWVRILQREDVLPYVLASYEAVALLGDYAPRVNPQQLKNALIFREECERVEKIIEEGRLSADRLHAAVERVDSAHSVERNRIAARLLRDLFCYHRDRRGLEAINAGLDSVNLVSDDKVRELSSLNGMLHEFLPPEDQKGTEERILHHVILKADVRDSTILTRSLMAKGMNAASYFSLNFYEPVNQLLSKVGAEKVFLEGDALIVAILEREGKPMLAVSRACVLAWEILSLVSGYNALLQRSGLPKLELGLGIAYQDSAPLYLMDGEHRIMISDAINESDRLSSCNKRIRKKIGSGAAGPFRVFTLQVGGSSDKGSESGADGATEELIINYNVSGIRLSEPAFNKLQQEISLAPWVTSFDAPAERSSRAKSREPDWIDDRREFFVGTVPLANGAFRKIVIRKSRIAQADLRDFSRLHWTPGFYYEVCADPAVYAALPGEKPASTTAPR
jgi:hypothetical protein